MLARYGKPLGIAACVAAVAWVMGFGYWRMNVTNALSAVEAQATPWLGDPRGFRVPLETENELKSAGDRALPYLVEMLNGDRSPAFQAALVHHYLELTNRIAPRETPDELKLVPSDPIETREQVISVVKMEWKHKWEPRFRWWMWWSGHGLQ